MHRGKLFAVLALLAVWLGAGMSAHASSVLGEWQLVEQSYGKGTANQIDPDAEPLKLTLYRSGAELEGRLHVGANRDGESWPRLVAGDSRAVRITDKRLSEPEDQVSVIYQVDPSPGDDLVLQVSETYRLSEDGASLTGEVTIEFIRKGIQKGSYTLHRRFERRSQ